MSLIPSQVKETMYIKEDEDGGFFRCLKDVGEQKVAVYRSYYGRYGWSFGYAVIIEKENGKDRLVYWKADKRHGGIYRSYDTYDTKFISEVRDMIANVRQYEDCEKVVEYVAKYFEKDC